MERKPYEVVLAYDVNGEPEVKHKLFPHTGDEGQAADLKIFAFADALQEDDSMDVVLQRPDYREIACLALDLEYKGEIYNSLTTLELFTAFMEALKFRTNQLQRKDFLEASKK